MRRNILLVVIVLASFVLAACATAQLVSTIRGIPNFHRVNDRLYRGGQPRRLGIKSLARLGIATIINLRETNVVWSAEGPEAHAVGITYTNVPMSGVSQPTDQQVMQVLTLLETARGPVFIHCLHGADRTGTIIACYRIKHDKWTSTQALREARQYGMSAWETGMKKYIKDFAKSH
jgi:protein tyrosine/serine phosphatase